MCDDLGSFHIVAALERSESWAVIPFKANTQQNLVCRLGTIKVKYVIFLLKEISILAKQKRAKKCPMKR